MRGLAIAVLLVGCTRTPHVADAWRVASIGVRPIEIETALPARCDRPALVVGTSGAWLLGDHGGPQPLAGPTDDASLEETLRRGVGGGFAFGALQGAYDGPGGEPLFRWHVEQPWRPTVVLDRGLSSRRLAIVLAAADAGSARTLVVAGVDGDGAATCFVTLRPAALEGAEAAREYEATADGLGHLTSERDGTTFTPDPALDPWPGQRDDVRVPVHVSLAPGAGVYGLVRGAARVPSLARWPVLAMPSAVPADPWHLAELNVEPIGLDPSRPTPCGDTVLAIGFRSLLVLEHGAFSAGNYDLDDAALAERLAAHVPAATGTYDWRVEHADVPTLLVDRRVPSDRLARVLRTLAPLVHAVRWAGVDAHGAPVCASTLTERALEGADVADAYEATVDHDGLLHVQRGGDAFVPDGTTAPWPGQGDAPRVPVHVRAAERWGGDELIRAAARVSSVARWPILVVPGPAPTTE